MLPFSHLRALMFVVFAGVQLVGYARAEGPPDNLGPVIPASEYRSLRYDFGPHSDGWYVPWRNDGHSLRFADTRQFPVRMWLEGHTPGAPSGFTAVFDVNAANNGIGETRIGRLTAVWNTGDVNASTISYAANAGANNTPAGASTITGSIWLGCTGRRGLVRGNAGASDSTAESLRLVYVGSPNLPRRVVPRAASPAHTVSCVPLH